MPSVAILIPVLDRPHRVAPLIESLNLSVEAERAEGWDVDAVFVCSPGDRGELAALKARGYLDPLIVDGGYARKVNEAARLIDADWFLTAADDLHFHPGWLTAAIAKHEETGALVIGTNDLANPTVTSGRHATHSVVHRDYLELGTIDDPTRLLHEGYDHNSVDCEFVETAQARGMFAHAAGSVVEHLHPTFNRSVRRDATYRKGMRHAAADKRLFHRRRHLWGYLGAEPVISRRVRG